jgi:hypothetical protein
MTPDRRTTPGRAFVTAAVLNTMVTVVTVLNNRPRVRFPSFLTTF